jgi:hypothetical protein
MQYNGAYKNYIFFMKNHEEEEQIVIITLMDLPTPIRVSISNFLDQASLMESTLVLKQWHNECNGPGIENKIIPVIEVSGSSTQTFLQNLVQHQQNNETNRKLIRYPHMRVNNIHKFDFIPLRELERIVNNLQIIDGVMSLDMSILSFAKICSSLPYALSQII